MNDDRIVEIRKIILQEIKDKKYLKEMYIKHRTELGGRF